MIERDLIFFRGDLDMDGEGFLWDWEESLEFIREGVDAERLVSILVSFANKFGLSGNIWHQWLAYALMMHENPYTLSSERRAVESDSTMLQLAKRDFAIFMDYMRADIGAIGSSDDREILSLFRDYRPPYKNAASSRSGSSSSRSNSRGGSGNRNSGGSRRSSAATANKKFMQSPIAMACYVFAALMMIYACYQAGSTIDQINQYYMSMGTQARPIEYILYVPQAMLGSLVNAFIFFMGGYILNAVRKLDPKNYKSEAEIKKEKAAKEAKKAEKEAAKAAVKEPAKTAKESFEESLEAELKKSEDKAGN